jgi:RNA methyltransferase, TrmH family
VPEPRRRPESARTIASASNEQVRFVKGLYRATVRRKERLFVVEGVRLVEDALGAGTRPEIVLVSHDQLSRTPRGVALQQLLQAYRCLSVSERVLDSVSDTVSPQGVVAVFQIPRPPTKLDLSPIILVLDRVRDPGNAGTVLRSADASGVARTVAFVDSVDAYAPKVVRAGMGAHFRLTILDDMTWDRLLPRLGNRPRHLAVAAGGIPYDQVDWHRDSALIIGGEAEGASAEAEQVATARVTIPMSGPTESLNAAMAATVLLFDAARVRRDAPRSLAPSPTRGEGGTQQATRAPLRFTPLSSHLGGKGPGDRGRAGRVEHRNEGRQGKPDD